MSSGRECCFLRDADGRWYYILQNAFTGPDAWDWREEAHSFGPFATSQKAEQHLHDNHANPGGWSTVVFGEPLEIEEEVIDYSTGDRKTEKFTISPSHRDEVYVRLIAEAADPKKDDWHWR